MDEEIKTISKWLGAGSVDIFGCPFSGKDTQGEILAKLFNGEMISGGDILRSHREPQKIAQVLDSGGIVPSDFYLDLVLPYLSQKKYAGKPLILSAVGRSHGEEPLVIKAAVDSGHPIKAVILLDLSEQEVWRRFDESKVEGDRGKRADDKRAIIENRLRKYTDRTLPVIDYYRSVGLLIEVNGNLPREEVTGQILKGLVNKSKKT
jgi:adenylate kinase